MLSADLYIRVSTDEQTDRGFSQRYQEEILKKYCQVNTIQVRKIVFEDYSAKNFHRPEWTLLMASLNIKSERPNLILFTKWDRFSRNAGDAYYVINQLQKMGIEARAVEQPLDLRIPENKMMMAFYLAIPEVENARRSLNVQQGMRRARKEGRWMGSAPIGYSNKTLPDGSKSIIPTEPQASFMKRAFEDLAQGGLNVNQIHKKLIYNGLICSLSNFWKAIRNPVYCGWLKVPKTEQEGDQIVKGQHVAIISEQLFHRAQTFLDSRKRSRTKSNISENLPLRGFLACPRCGKVLTGSKSRGRSNYYLYYHCCAKCGYRIQGTSLNKSFVSVLSGLLPTSNYQDQFKNALEKASRKIIGTTASDSLKAFQQIDSFTKRIEAGKDLLLNGDITGDDYRTIKVQCEAKISLLGDKIKSLRVSSAFIKNEVSNACQYIVKVDRLYKVLPLSLKRDLIKALFKLPLRIATDHFEGLELTLPALNIFRENSLSQINHAVENSLLSTLAEMCMEVILIPRPTTDFTF